MHTTPFRRLCTLLAASLLAVPVASATGLGPDAPTALAATVTGPGEITLTWNASSSLLGIAAYRVYRVEVDGSRTHLVDVDGANLTFLETGLARGTAYTYAVSAVDALGEGPASEPASATTWDVPTAPQELAVASGPALVGEATLTWSAPASDGGAAVLAYHVYRDGALIATVDATTLSFTDAGLSPLQAYAYAVSAANVVGEGAAVESCGVASPWAAELGCGLTL